MNYEDNIFIPIQKIANNSACISWK